MLARSLLSLCCVSGLVLTGCSSGTKVGSGVDTNVKGKNGALSLGGSATASPKATARRSAVPVRTAAAAHTAAPARSKAPAPQQTQKTTTFAISINGDNSGTTAFAPPQSAVYAGTVIVFTNHDTVARSVTARDGVFRSPTIAPGATWRYTAKVPGKHTYQDGTRPYAVGTLEVLAR